MKGRNRRRDRPGFRRAHPSSITGEQISRSMRYVKLRSQVGDTGPVRKAGGIRDGTASIYEPLFKKSIGVRNVNKMENRKLEMGGRKR